MELSSKAGSSVVERKWGCTCRIMIVKASWITPRFRAGGPSCDISTGPGATRRWSSGMGKASMQRDTRTCRYSPREPTLSPGGITTSQSFILRVRSDQTRDARTIIIGHRGRRRLERGVDAVLRDMLEENTIFLVDKVSLVAVGESPEGTTDGRA